MHELCCHKGGAMCRPDDVNYVGGEDYGILKTDVVSTNLLLAETDLTAITIADGHEQQSTRFS